MAASSLYFVIVICIIGHGTQRILNHHFSHILSSLIISAIEFISLNSRHEFIWRRAH